MRTNVQKLPLVIHVEGFGLVLLGKTCRLCLRCDTLVAHKAELDELLRVAVGVPEPEYVVLGSIDSQVYRRGLSGRTSLDDVKDHMADFKSYWKVDVTPAGWCPKWRLNRRWTRSHANRRFLQILTINSEMDLGGLS